MEKKEKLTYSEKPVELTAEGLKCSCGALMQLFTVHCSERGGEILSKVYVCPKCNNEAGLKLSGEML